MWSKTYNERRLTRVEARAKSNTHRIDKLEPIVEEIHTMSETMVQLVEEVKHTNENVCALDEKIDSMDARVDVMERAPAEDVKKYKSVAITAIISTISTALAIGLVSMIAQYINKKEEVFNMKNCVFKANVDTVKWFKAAGIRAVKTMAQTAVAVIGTAAVVSSVDWKLVVSSAIVSGVVSLLTSVAGIPEVKEE